MSNLDRAVVKREFGDVVREGRGFSLQELQSAGIDPHHARRIGVQIDVLRKSAHQENVDRLAPYAKRIKDELAAKKSRPRQTAPAKTESAPAEPEAKTAKGKGRKAISLKRTKKKD